jgi:biotin transport system substrate-specific component
MIVGTVLIYLFWLGSLVLAGMSPLHAIELGVLPFLVGDALKAALASAALPSAWAIVRRMDQDEDA